MACLPNDRTYDSALAAQIVVSVNTEHKDIHRLLFEKIVLKGFCGSMHDPVFSGSSDQKSDAACSMTDRHKDIYFNKSELTVMRRPILFAAILLMLLISFANAFSFDMPEMQKNVDAYNSKIDNAPAILKGMLGNEKINLDITRDDGSVFRVGLDMVNARRIKRLLMVA